MAQQNLHHDFGAVLLYALLSVAFVIASLTIGAIIRPRHPYGEKLSTYECGEDTIGTAFVQFNVRFYVIALIFLIFDVEVAALIPWAVIYRKFGLPALVEMGIFMLILIAGFAYIWVRRDLEWVKSLGEIVPELREEFERDRDRGEDGA